MKVQPILTTCISIAAVCTVFYGFLKRNNLTYNPLIERDTEKLTSQEWEIVSVHDGDTIKVKKDGIIENVRFCGIDAPEISQPMGKESRDYLRTLLFKKTVQVSIVDTDRYNRKVGEIFITQPETFINQEMALSGMAYSYAKYKNCPNQEAIQKGEVIAQSKGVGVWSGNYQTPWDYRKAKRNK